MSQSAAASTESSDAAPAPATRRRCGCVRLDKCSDVLRTPCSTEHVVPSPAYLVPSHPPPRPVPPSPFPLPSPSPACPAMAPGSCHVNRADAISFAWPAKSPSRWLELQYHNQPPTIGFQRPSLPGVGFPLLLRTCAASMRLNKVAIPALSHPPLACLDNITSITSTEAAAVLSVKNSPKAETQAEPASRRRQWKAHLGPTGNSRLNGTAGCQPCQPPSQPRNAGRHRLDLRREGGGEGLGGVTARRVISPSWARTSNGLRSRIPGRTKVKAKAGAKAPASRLGSSLSRVMLVAFAILGLGGHGRRKERALERGFRPRGPTCSVPYPTRETAAGSAAFVLSASDAAALAASTGPRAYRAGTMTALLYHCDIVSRP